MAWTIPDKGEGDNDIQSIAFQEHLDILVDGIGGRNCVIEGCAVTGGADMTPAVASGIVISNGVRFVVAGADVTVTTADGTHPRIDLIVVTSAGALAVRAGTAAAAPKPPARTSNDVVLAAVYVPASDTSIETTKLTDMRVMRPDLNLVRRPPDIILRSGNGIDQIPDFIGLGAIVAVGGLTGSIGYMDFTTFQYQRPRFSAANGGSSSNMQCLIICGVQEADGDVPFLWRSNVAGRGGFRIEVEFKPEHLHSPPEMNGFFGVRAAALPAGENVLTTGVSVFGVGFNRTSFTTGNMQLIHNDGSGAPTVTDLGASYPAEGDDAYYCLVIESLPNGSDITWSLTNMVTGASTGGTVSSNIPASTTPLLISLGLNKTGTSTGSFGFELGQLNTWNGSSYKHN